MPSLTLGQIESNPRFKSASIEDQQKIRVEWFRTFMPEDPTFKSFTDQQKNELFTKVITREPVFANEAAPEVLKTKELIAKARAGDALAKEALLAVPYANSLAKSTFVGTIGTWTVEKLQDLINPGNTNSPRDYVLGPESDKLEALIKREIPEAGYKSELADVVGLVGGFAESALIGYLASGTALAPKGFSKPLAEKFASKAATMAAGAPQRILQSIGPETAQALGSGLGFSITESLKMAAKGDPLSVGEIAKQFGENVALDYAFFMATGAMSRVARFLKATYLSGSYQDRARETIAQAVSTAQLTGDWEPLLQQLDAIDPDAGALVRREHLMDIPAKLNMRDPVDKLRVFAGAKNMVIVEAPDSIGKTPSGHDLTGRRFRVETADGSEILAKDVNFSDLVDFVSKTTDPSELRLTPHTQMSLGQRTRIEIDMDQATHDKDMRIMFNERRRSEDPGLFAVNFAWVAKAEGLGAYTDEDQALIKLGKKIISGAREYSLDELQLQANRGEDLERILRGESLGKTPGMKIKTVPVQDLFGATEADVSPGAPAGRYQWGVGTKVNVAGSEQVFFPIKGQESGAPSVQYLALKERLRGYVKRGLIPVPDKFSSWDQMGIYEKMMSDIIGDEVLAIHPELTVDGKNIVDSLNEYLKPYGLRHSAGFRGRDVAENLGIMTRDPGATHYIGRAMSQMDLESLNELTNLAYGPLDDVTGEIRRLARLQTIQAPDGTTTFRISLKEAPDEKALWHTVTGPDGKPLEYASRTELRRALLERSISTGRVSNETLRTMISMRSGYRLLTPGQSLTKAVGDSVDSYRVVLQQSPTVKGHRVVVQETVLDPHTIAEAPTLEELFRKFPELYDTVADAYASSSTVRAVYESANPYVEFTGRVFSGSSNDIFTFLRDRKSKRLIQEMFRPDVNKGLSQVLEESMTKPNSKRVIGQSRPQLVFNRLSDTIFLTPVEGGRTLRFGGKKTFSAIDELQEYLASNMAVFDNISMNMALKGYYVDIMPNGSVIAINGDGDKRIFSSRRQLNEFFQKDIFEGIGLTHDEADVARKAMAEIVGANAEFNENMAAVAMSMDKTDGDILEKIHSKIVRPVSEPIEMGEPPAFELRRTSKLAPRQVEFSNITYKGRQMRLDLSKTYPFGWELSIGRGTASLVELDELFKRHNLKPILEGNTIRISVGSRDKAQAVAEELDLVKGISNGATDGRRRLEGRVMARFLDPGAAPIDDPAQGKILFGNFYAGGRGYRYESGTAYGTLGRLSRTGLHAQYMFQVPFAPMDETVETMLRLDAVGAKEGFKLLQEKRLLDRMASMDATPWQVRTEQLFGKISKDKSRMYSMLFHLPETSWDHVGIQFNMKITPEDRQKISQFKQIFNEFAASQGYSTTADTIISRVNDFNLKVSALAAKAAGGDIPHEELEKLFNEFKNAENMPMLLKVFSDTMRPDELMQFLKFDDLKTFMQKTIDSVMHQKYYRKLKDRAAKLYMDLSVAKANKYSNYLTGSDKLWAETLDQILGKETALEQTVNGILSEYSDAFYRVTSKIPILRDFAEDLQFHNGMMILSQRASRITQGGKVFNVIRNGTQIQLQAAAIGTGRVLRAHDYVLRNPGYINKLMAREAISKGFFDRVSNHAGMARLRDWWTIPLENSEVINRATTIKAAEDLLDDYLPRLAKGLETDASFLKAIKADNLYESEQQLLMHFVKSGQNDAAADYLGSLWQKMTQFVYNPEELGLAFRGFMGKAWGKFMVQNTSTVAYVWKLMRTKMNPVAAVSAGLRVAAVMYATQKAFEALGVQYDGFKPINMFSITGGPTFKFLVDMGNATGDPAKAARYLKSAGRTIWGTQVPFAPQADMIQRAARFYQGGRYWDALLALSGAPTRLEDQLLYLESFER